MPYAVIDGDTDKKKEDQKAEQRKDNLTILRICDLGDKEPMPAEDFITENCTIWSTNITGTLRKEAGETVWNEVDQAVRKKRGFEQGVNSKNKLYTAAMIEELGSRGFTSDTLTVLCNNILAYADEKKEAPGALIVGRTKNCAAEKQAAEPVAAALTT